MFSPRIWIHAALWTPLLVAGATLMLRPIKPGLIALPYHHRLLPNPSRPPSPPPLAGKG